MTDGWDVRGAQLILAVALSYLAWQIARVCREFPGEPAPSVETDDERALAQAKEAVKDAAGEPDFDHDLVKLPCGGTVDFESIPEKARSIRCSKGCTHSVHEVKVHLDSDIDELVRTIAALWVSGPPLLAAAAALCWLGWRGRLDDYAGLWQPAAALCCFPFLLMRVLPRFFVEKS